MIWGGGDLSRFFGYMLFLALLPMLAAPVQAHRLGESYIYVDVNDVEMIGRFHIRLADVNKAVSLDANGDGIVSEAEFDTRAPDVYRYLTERLSFHAGGAAHRVEISGHRYFGSPIARQVSIEFAIPSLGPPPDAISVEYRFLYDGPDPAHRPMLLQASNTRLNLEDNESMVSLVFGTEAQRQELSLVAPPRLEIFRSFALDGLFRILSKPIRILAALALLLPVVMLRSGAAWRARETAGSVASDAAVVVTAFTLAFAATLALPTYGLLVPSKLAAQALFAVSIVLLAVDNFRPLPRLRRVHVALIVGALQGLGPNGFVDDLGLNRGFAEIALGGFGLGIWVAMALIAGVALPLLFLVRSAPLYEKVALRYASVPLMLGAALWFVGERVFV